MPNYNQQFFSRADVAAGLHMQFIGFLLENFRSNEYRLDMHVYHEDCGAVVVEWIRQLWGCEDDMGGFKFVDGDEVVKKIV